MNDNQDDVIILSDEEDVQIESVVNASKNRCKQKNGIATKNHVPAVVTRPVSKYRQKVNDEKAINHQNLPSKTKKSSLLTSKNNVLTNNIEQAEQQVQKRTPVLVLKEPQSDSYGIQRGYTIERLHGVIKVDKQLYFLVQYTNCMDYELVPSTILNELCNNKVIDYFQNTSIFID